MHTFPNQSELIYNTSELQAARSYFDDIVFLHVAGEVTTLHAEQMLNIVRECVADGFVHIIVDTDLLVYADSHAVGVAISALDLTDKKGGSFVIARSSGSIRKLWEMAKMTCKFDFARPTIMEAMALVKKDEIKKIRAAHRLHTPGIARRAQILRVNDQHLPACLHYMACFIFPRPFWPFTWIYWNQNRLIQEYADLLDAMGYDWLAETVRLH